MKTKLCINVTTPDAFDLETAIKGKKGILDVKAVTFTSANVYYDVRHMNETEVRALVDSENKKMDK